MEREQMNPQVLSYAHSEEQFWIGLDTPGMTRKVFKLVSDELVNAEHLIAGVTIFEPGESSSFHHHPGSEEINFVLAGSGVMVTDDGEEPFVSTSVMYIPAGKGHQHRNTGDVPLILGWAYSPQAEMPTT